MLTLKDQTGVLNSFPNVPLRIISLVPSQTELLFDLGLETKIVGVTKFCVHPFYAKSVAKVVGGTKKVHYEKIRLLQPDLIIANKEENTLEIVEELRKICTVWVTDIVTIEDNFKMISDFGQIFNKRTEAQKWNDKIRNGLNDFKSFVANAPFRKVAYFIWREPFMVAGKDTFINELLELNHFENIYKEERYPEVVIENLRTDGDPDLIFLSSEPYPFKEEHAFEIGRFTHHAKTVFVDGEMFSWYGSRLLKAFNYFKQLHQRIE